jgi:glycerol-3-phosphate acyltransferase PlsY
LCGAFLDAIKSYIAVILALIIFRYSIYYWIPKWWSLIYIAGSFAVIGHCFPLQCIIKKQKGGKGVATAGGVLFSVSPWIGLIAFGIWFITLLISRYVSIASILCMVLAPFCIFITQLDYFYLISNKWFINSHISLVFCNDAKYLLFALIYSNSLLVVFRHQTNLFNLLHKKENKFF